MNDFFTDLDTDLQGVQKTSYIPQNPIKQVPKFIPSTKEKEISIVKPTMKKPEHRESREKTSTIVQSPSSVVTPH
ncbi:MAG: hypothetical protein WC774_00500, partial [Candidatus Gracilibacteria bacterium]